MENAGIAAVLDRISSLMEVKGEIRFKIQAYQKAARMIEGFDRPLAEVHAAGGEKALRALPGIGEGLAAKIAELVSTGKCREYEKLKASLPRGLEALLAVPGLGPKNALKLATSLKISSLDGLAAAIARGKIRGLPGFGAKAEAKLGEALATIRQAQDRLPLGRALPIAEALLRRLRALPDTARAELAGSLRRRRETVGDVDLLVAPRRPAGAARIMDAFTKAPGVGAVLAKGTTKASVRLAEGLQADLRVVEAAGFGAALHYFTGSKAHNIQLRERGVKRGLKINEYGVFKGRRRIGGREEREVFAAVGLPEIPPEVREGAGEIEAAAAGKLPALLAERDLKGDLHAHTDWSDGTSTLEAMVEAARGLGYAYLALCDHSRSLKMAGGLSIEALRRKNRAIDAVNRTLKGLTVLKGAEVDILEDGSLDYPDDVLAELDVVVASIHTRFGLDEAAQTRRAVRALANPRVTLLAHPTGRLLGKRAGYRIDLDAVIAAAKRHGKALELNAQTERLDLAEGPLKRARDAGVTIVVNADAHHASQLALARRLGVPQARRAWLTAAHVLNALPAAELKRRLAR